MKTKTKPALLATLAKVAPSISIQTDWSPDCDMFDIRKHCDGYENEDPNDWQAWQSEVSAKAILDGREVSGSDYLGGTWEKACDHPAKSNPDISGYFPDMVREALSDLSRQLITVNDTKQKIELCEQIEAAIAAL